MNMNIGRGWFTILGIIGIVAQFLLPDLPVDPEWHKTVDKIPGCIGAINTFLGWRAYDLTRDGETLLKPQEPPKS